MITTNRLFIVLLIAVATSCTDSANMLTVINSDGTCYREFNENANPEFLMGKIDGTNNPFPVELDSNWEIKWTYDNTKLRSDFPLSKSVYDSICRISAKTAKNTSGNSGLNVRVFVRRNYNSVAEMDSTFRLKKNHKWSSMKVKHSLDKRFRWFYTYYTYRETYPKLNIGFDLPIENYMTKNEALFWLTGKPNILSGMNGLEINEYLGGIESNFQKWFNQNIWNLEYKVLIDNYQFIENQPVSKEKIVKLRDSIFEAKVNKTENFEMKLVLDDYFKTKAFSAFWDIENSPMKKFEQEFEDRTFINNFKESIDYRLIMPGTILNPHNAVVKGDTLWWKLTTYRMIPADYCIEAESRKPNIWAFVLSGIIIIIALVSIFWKQKK